MVDTFCLYASKNQANKRKNRLNYKQHIEKSSKSNPVNLEGNQKYAVHALAFKMQNAFRSPHKPIKATQ